MELLDTQVMAYLAGKSLPVLLGSTGGFLYYKFVGCKTGTCPLTSNPWISTLYGALIGLMLAQR